jgi:hypothetical protein
MSDLMSDNNNQNYDDKLTEIPRQKTYESEEEIFSRLINPEAKTSYEEVVVYDKDKKEFVTRAKPVGVPELNLSDLTTAILVGQKSEFSFAWHTINLINQWVYLQKETGYDFSNIIRFHYNNLMTNLSLSKSVGGTLVNSLTTKKIRQIQEINDRTQENNKTPQSLGEWLKGTRKKAREMYND